jgi:hypothetical protein
MPWNTAQQPVKKKAAPKKAAPKRKAKAMPKIKKPKRRKQMDVPVEFYEAPGVPPLFNHQGETRDHLLNVPCTYDASDPGTGKTRSEVEAWAARRRAGGGCLLVLSNLDAVKWLMKQPAKFFDKFDELVIDEATAYKNPSSGRSKAAVKIKDYFEFRRLLCGTPMPKGVIDMWHQMFLVDDGARLGTSYYKFPVITNSAQRCVMSCK